MAEEEFLNLDDEDEETLEEETLAATPQDVEERLDKEQNNKLLYLLIILLMAGVAILSGIFFYLYMKKKHAAKPQEVNATKIVEKVIQKEQPAKENTQVQSWLKEAEKRFKEGKKEEALRLYRKIARYNEALSWFNIGVAHLKDHNYTKAISAFDKASFDDAFKCESALNAAVCAYNLKEKRDFSRYLRLAREYLIFKKDSPLFSYYNTLINYYQNAYPETLASITHPTSDYFRNNEFFIGSKIYTSYESLQNAINMLEHADDAKNFFTLGLLYANIGRYTIAADYLKKAIEIGDHLPQARMALSITQNRMGNLATAADLMEEAAQKETNATEIYPIKVVLRKSLFDPVVAQEVFKKNLLLDKFYRFSLLFYFAPYKLSLYDNALKTIKKGVRNIDIDKTDSAMAYLVTGKNIAQVNLEIARAIDFSLRHRLYETAAIFKDALKKYPWDAVLHYNLGLAYAQMFNFKDAYHEFARSQTLDPSLFEAAIFKSYCAGLINKDPTIENLNQIYDLLSLSRDKAYKNRIQALLNIARETYAIPNGYLPVDKHPFDTAIDLIIAYNRAQRDTYKKSADGLRKLLPRDLVANILYIDAHFSHQDIKRYARIIQQRLLESNLDFKPLYTGETLPRELYIEMLNIAGVEHKLLERVAEKEKRYGKFIAFRQTKALAEIYAQRFEDAYQTYNTLIDTCKQSDTHTLFLASVAAIGADHPANAIALLELAKLTDSSNMESRYALGLLYQEAKNFDGAVIQYKKIGNSGFGSRYFTFYITKP